MSITEPSEICIASLFIDFEGFKKSARGLTGAFLFPFLFLVSCLSDAFIEVIFKKAGVY